MEPNSNPTEGISRSGLILGAAGLAGAAALGLPVGAGAAPAANRTTHRPVEHAITSHPHYNRMHFDRARAVAEVRDPASGSTMTLRVEDLVALKHTADARPKSVEWGAGFSALLVRTKGAALESGTYPTTINNRTFPLTITRVGDRTYQVIVDRRTPKGRTV